MTPTCLAYGRVADAARTMFGGPFVRDLLFARLCCFIPGGVAHCWRPACVSVCCCYLSTGFRHRLGVGPRLGFRAVFGNVILPTGLLLRIGAYLCPGTSVPCSGGGLFDMVPSRPLGAETQSAVPEHRLPSVHSTVGLPLVAFSRPRARAVLRSLAASRFFQGPAGSFPAAQPWYATSWGWLHRCAWLPFGITARARVVI